MTRLSALFRALAVALLGLLASGAAVGSAAPIMIVVLGFNFLGDGLRDVLEPRLRMR